MGRSFEKVMGAAAGVAEAAVGVTGSLVAKGRETADRIALESKLRKIQRQLGAVVYSLRKTGSENEQLVERYIAEIDFIKSELAAYDAPRKDPVSLHVCPGCGEGVQEDAMFCGRCGAQLSQS